MAGWRRRVVAFHEAGHAVVSRHFGLGVTHVAARQKDSMAQSESAYWLAKGLDVSD
jgi:hypothetical protein